MLQAGDKHPAEKAAAALVVQCNDICLLPQREVLPTRVCGQRCDGVEEELSVNRKRPTRMEDTFTEQHCEPEIQTSCLHWRTYCAQSGNF